MRNATITRVPIFGGDRTVARSAIAPQACNFSSKNLSDAKAMKQRFWR
ncbi:hypothetical protein [Nostoc commune]|nr:hypothetical protein [Nostoc commune]